MPTGETPLEMLKRHEGLRLFPYQCSANKTTIGYGHNLTDKGISEKEALDMLVHDMESAMRDVHQIFPEYSSYSQNRRLALLDMVFNLGKTKFLGFRRMISAILDEDWDRAAAEALDSRWYTQVGNRGVEVVNMLLKG